MGEDQKTPLYPDRGAALNLSVVDNVGQLLIASPYCCSLLPELLERAQTFDIPTYTATSRRKRDGQNDKIEAEQVSPLRQLVEAGVIGELPLPEEDLFSQVIELSKSFAGITAKIFAMASRDQAIVLTDDAATHQSAATVTPKVKIITTPGLLHQLATRGNIAEPTMIAAVRQIATRACFRPSTWDPHRGWWMNLLQDGDV